MYNADKKFNYPQKRKNSKNKWKKGSFSQKISSRHRSHKNLVRDEKYLLRIFFSVPLTLYFESLRLRVDLHLKRESIYYHTTLCEECFKSEQPRLSQTHEREEKTLSQRDDDINDACSRFSSRANLNPKQKSIWTKERIFFPLIFPQ